MIDTLLNTMEAAFKQHPERLFSMQELAKIGGTGGFRTRVSELRLKRGMVIENYQRVIKTKDGRAIRESFYRYVPPADHRQQQGAA